MPAEGAPPSTAPEEPATPDKPSDEVEDLFKDFDDKKDAGGDTSATSNEKATEGELEELFNQPPAESPMSSQAAPVDPLTQEAEKLFAQTAAGSAAAASALSSERDETQLERARSIKATRPVPCGCGPTIPANTRSVARLVVVGRTHVRLLKENGKYSTVPHGRLSRNDLAFVRQVDQAIVASF